MHPQNEMTNVYVSDIIVFDENTVMFRFDLNAYPVLRDPVVVEACVWQFVSSSPNAEGWRAEINNTQNVLNLIIVGKLNADAVKKWSK